LQKEINPDNFKNEVLALINLLDDTEEGIDDVAVKRLMEIGVACVPFLENAWEHCLNNELQTRIENLIQDIQFDDVCSGLRNWDLMNGTSLFEGACIIARLQYPELKVATYRNTLESIAGEIKPIVKHPLTPLEQIKAFNHIFYNTQQFTGNISNYYTPQNYYINNVIDARKGNPVTLGIIYITLAEIVGLPVFGVNLPKNFILVYKDLNIDKKEYSPLFYINPYNKGAILGKREIDLFLEQQKISPDESYFYPCSNRSIIERLITNLVKSNESGGQTEKAQKFTKLLNILK
jgi:regulator of sirC expression with transglutaminase-like and TPR domain